MTNVPQFLSPAPPPAMRTWRCKAGPVRLGARDCPNDPRGMSSRAPIPPVASPPSDMMALSGTRTKAVRLARLNPGLLRRFEEEEGHRSPWPPTSGRTHAGSHRSCSSGPCVGISRVHSDMVAFLPPGPDIRMPLHDLDSSGRSNDLPGKWSLSLPPVRGAVSRRANDHVDPMVRDGLLVDRLDPHQRTNGMGAEDMLPYEVRKDAVEDRHRYLKEIEALKRHCNELDYMVHQLRDEQDGPKSATPRAAVSARKERPPGLAEEGAHRGLEAEQGRHFTSLPASARARDEDVARQRSEVEAACKARLSSMEARLASMEARLVSEESRRADAEDELRDAAQRAAWNAKVARSRALAFGVMHADAVDRSMGLAVFGAWRACSAESRLQARLEAEVERHRATEAAKARAEEERLELVGRISEVEATAAKEQGRLQVLVAATEARLSNAEARCAAAEEEQVRLRQEADERLREAEACSAAAIAEEQAKWQRELEAQQAALVREHERALRKQADAAKARLKDEVAHGADTARAEQARRRALCAGEAWARTSERAALLPVMAVWHEAVRQRRVVGALQTKLFEEEACRGAALREQKTELDARFAEAEAKHRNALHCLRAELLEAEARCADVVNAREVEAAQRLVSSEAPNTPRTDSAEEDEVESPALRASEALRALQARAEVRMADAEVRHAEELLAERERADARLALAEARQREALRQVQEAADRRLAAVEAEHAEALQELRSAADQRLLEAEVRNTQLLHLLQEIPLESDEAL
uniref:Uncharacterized protein n=1 Tax=Pyrodinium bahamense TaxID=73915 RepID=A0A7S0ALZ0_9DINO